jgi:hypothetical protein
MDAPELPESSLNRVNDFNKMKEFEFWLLLRIEYFPKCLMHSPS